MNDSVELTPAQTKKLAIFGGALLVLAFVVQLRDFLRERGHGKDIPNPHHILFVGVGDYITYVLRGEHLLDGCFIRYRSAFDGNEIDQTLKYNYTYNGAYWDEDRDLMPSFADDAEVCQPGDVFKTDFSVSEPNNHRIIKNDLYRMEPP